MNITITLPKHAIAEVDALAKEKKNISRKRTLRKLVLQSLETERKRRIARLYQRGRKTLRQCAEMLGTDVEGMMKILYDLDIPLSNGSADDFLKNLKMIREQQPWAFKAPLDKDGGKA